MAFAMDHPPWTIRQGPSACRSGGSARPNSRTSRLLRNRFVALQTNLTQRIDSTAIRLETSFQSRQKWPEPNKGTAHQNSGCSVSTNDVAPVIVGAAGGTGGE
jgi:hypothetical protein